MAPNTAIFYDIENLIGPFTGKANTILHLDEIYRRVLAAEGVEGVSIQRAYADWVLPIHRNLRGSVLQVGIEPVQIFNTNPYDKVKNAADVSLIIDAVELIAKRPDISTYVIASGDGIFAFLAKKLHEHGKRVIGIGFDKIVNMIFRNACDVYIGLEKTDKTLVDTIHSIKKIEQKPHVLPAAPADEAPAVPAKVPSKFPKTKYSDAIVAANIPVWRDIADASGSLMAVRKLLEVLHTDATQDLPDLEISVFMTYLNHYVPGFKVNRFGFSRFSNFMRFMLTRSPLTLYVAENSHKIARRGTIGEKGEVIEDIAGLQFILPDASRYNSIFDVPEGSSFIHTITPQEKPTPKPLQPRTKAKSEPKPKPVSVRAKAAEAKPKLEKPKPVKESPKPRKAREPKAKPVPALPPIVIDEGSIRKWIKNQFEELSKENKLPSAEARRLTNEDYAQKTFGIRTPIFRAIETHSNLDEQRKVNGKTKYWKETFKFNGKFYLVYKEWVAALHTERFAAWIAGFKK
ncbi:MAG: NYN domain-containing protein [Defluviitaleaceae bacterium]|nr:NYN domain-containing protein [Defluviitaleaceae bacterium]MCL2238324.1 NYN domain-containing protein [Defluviitaleaceae bacterium]